MSHVGIFWFVPANFGGWSALVTDMAPLEEMPEQGGLKRHPRSHAGQWAELAQLGVRGLRARGYPRIIAEADYRTYPRGRVEFEVGGRRFIVRADARLQGQEFIAQVVAHFDIPVGHLTVFPDPGYVSVGPLHPPKPWD